MVENVIHLVLARPEGAGAGTKGLSLFVVPEWHFDVETGELGERNGAFVTNVEHKMGLKASTTCELRFGEIDDIPAKGWLVGDVHNGIAQMFQVIEHARMMVGTKAIATLSTGYLNALEYAKTRVQSADLTRGLGQDRAARRDHQSPGRAPQPDANKAYAEGLRALVYYTASFQDKIIVGEHDRHGRRARTRRSTTCCCRSSRAPARSAPTTSSPRRCRPSAARATCRTTRSSSTSATPRSTPCTRAPRRSRAQDFFFRKIVRNKGAALGALSAEITEFLASIEDEGRLKEERAAVQKALEDFGGIVGAMFGQLMSGQEDVRNVYKVGQNTTRALLSAGDLMVGYLLLRQAAVALEKLDANGVRAADRAFYEGKPAVARFFAQTVLPELTARRAVAEAIDNALMDVPEAAF